MRRPPPTPELRFEALFRSHRDEVHRFVARRTDASAVEDVVSETFAICWRRLDVVPPGHELPWLYLTARHLLLSRTRADGREADKRRRAGAGAVPVGRDPAEALADRDLVVRAFLELGEADREALRLVAWEGLSLADGARAAGVSRPAFAMRVHRARRKLGHALAGTKHPGVPRPRPTVEQAP